MSGGVRFIRVRGRVVPIRTDNAQEDKQGKSSRKKQIAAGAAIGGVGAGVASTVNAKAKINTLEFKMAEAYAAEHTIKRTTKSQLSSVDMKLQSKIKGIKDIGPGPREKRVSELLMKTESELGELSSQINRRFSEIQESGPKSIMNRILGLEPKKKDLGRMRAIKALEVLDTAQGRSKKSGLANSYREFSSLNSRASVLEKRRTFLWDEKFRARDSFIESMKRDITKYASADKEAIQKSSARKLKKLATFKTSLADDIAKTTRRNKGLWKASKIGIGAIIGAGIASRMYTLRRREK